MIAPESHSEDVLGHSLEMILDETASPERAVSAGATAAISVAMAAALACATARLLPAGPDSSGLVVQAESLRIRATELIEKNRRDYEVARVALAARQSDPGYRDHRIGEALGEALSTLGQITRAAADTAEISAHIASLSDPALRPDAASAAVLAEAGARVSLGLVEANLLSSERHEIRLEAVEDLRTAVSSRQRAGELAAGS